MRMTGWGRLGADRILEREALAAGAARPLDSGEWAGAVDVVGGKRWKRSCPRLKRHGTAVACGLAGGHALHTTVFPFILRGVCLIGVDTNTCPCSCATESLGAACPLDDR